MNARFVFGFKDQEGSPEGLFDAAAKNDEQNIIHVSQERIYYKSW